MAKLLDKLMNRVIKGKLTLESDDDISSLEDVDLHVKSINAKGGAISGPLAVTGNVAFGGDLDVNGNVRGKTLSQSEANYDFDFAELLQAEDSQSFEVVGSPFAHFKVINGCLHIVCCVSFHNKAQETKSLRLGQIAINLPEDISSKIYNVDGYSANEAGHAGFVRTAFLGYSDTNSATIRLNNSSTANQVVLYHPSPRNITADTSISLSFEMTLTIV